MSSNYTGCLQSCLTLCQAKHCSSPELLTHTWGEKKAIPCKTVLNASAAAKQFAYGVLQFAYGVIAQLKDTTVRSDRVIEVSQFLMFLH